jgi:hypothetical protein
MRGIGKGEAPVGRRPRLAEAGKQQFGCQHGGDCHASANQHHPVPQAFVMEVLPAKPQPPEQRRRPDEQRIGAGQQQGRQHLERGIPQLHGVTVKDCRQREAPGKERQRPGEARQHGEAQEPPARQPDDGNGKQEVAGIVMQDHRHRMLQGFEHEAQRQQHQRKGEEPQPRGAMRLDPPRQQRHADPGDEDEKYRCAAMRQGIEPAEQVGVALGAEMHHQHAD